MAILKSFDKQPGEVQDYDISFADWLAALSDTAASFAVTAETGITLGDTSLTSGVVKAWLSGGVHGTRYKITASVTTAGGRTKEDEIMIRVKET